MRYRKQIIGIQVKMILGYFVTGLSLPWRRTVLAFEERLEATQVYREAADNENLPARDRSYFEMKSQPMRW